MSEKNIPDNELRNLLETAADDPPVDEDAAWLATVDRLDDSRRRAPWLRPALVFATTAAIALAVIVALSVNDSGSGEGETDLAAGEGLSDSAESRIVARTTSGGLVVLDDTGNEQRVLDAGDGEPLTMTGFEAARQVAAGDDRVYIVTEQLDTGCANADQIGDQIWSVPLDGASTEPEFVVNGRFPTLSPDGRQLAYVTTTSGEPCLLDQGLTVEIIDIATGTVAEQYVLGDQTIGATIGAVTWPSSRNTEPGLSGPLVGMTSTDPEFEWPMTMLPVVALADGREIGDAVVTLADALVQLDDRYLIAGRFQLEPYQPEPDGDIQTALSDSTSTDEPIRIGFGTILGQPALPVATLPDVSDQAEALSIAGDGLPGDVLVTVADGDTFTLYLVADGGVTAIASDIVSATWLPGR